MTTGFYPGSFDPLTNGHLDVIEAAASFCDRLVVGIGLHPGKTPMFTAERRAAMVASVCGPRLAARDCRLETTTFDALTVQAAADRGATLMIRGLRDATDFDYELQLAGMNAAMAPAIQTIFIPPTVRSRHISATLVRQIAKLGGDVSPFVPPEIVAALAEVRLSQR